MTPLLASLLLAVLALPMLIVAGQLLDAHPTHRERRIGLLFLGTAALFVSPLLLRLWALAVLG